MTSRGIINQYGIEGGSSVKCFYSTVTVLRHIVSVMCQGDEH